jgi:two-component system cell cycle response regulator CtrA
MRILLGCPDNDRAGLRHLIGQPPGHIVDLASPFDDLPSAALHSGPYDVVVIAVSDARTQAMPALRELRRCGVRQPVLVVTARASAEDEGALLNLGADDVMTGPVSACVLVARLRASMRRALGHASPVLVCGNVALDQVRQTVSVDGRPAGITRREFEVLEVLMLRRGTLLTKEQVMARLYADEDEAPDARIVDVFVCKLRRKLAAAGAAEIVRTAWGRGYIVEDPGPGAIAAARARHAAGLPRARRAHLLPMHDLGLVAV